MDIDKLKNPFIKVTWEDIPENFTQEKIKRVRSYFQNKYNSRNITVLTRAVERDGTGDLDIDIEQNVMDTIYQRNLMTQFVENNDMQIDISLLKRLDEKVNVKMAENVNIETHYKRVYIKNIKFSNFLSFGDNNMIDIKSLGGITVIDSNPPNFGGKSVLAVDLILFLFFNTTTKSSKASDIFNRFRKSNEVIVQGEVEIDGRDFIIIRKIKRRKTKKGDWSVSTSLEFLEKKSDGSLQNFTGEQRRETENFIKESIGTMNDFLLTVLSTASNLESIIESKPTERGNILSRFVGLEILKEKETVAKQMYSNWSKKLISNVYNKEELKQESKKLTKEIEDFKELIDSSTSKTEKLIIEIDTENKTKETLLSQKFSSIDEGVEKINPRLTEEKINEEVSNLDKLNLNLKGYGENDSPPPVDLETLKNKKEGLHNKLISKTQNITNYKHTQRTIKQLEESEICPLCKRNLEDVDHSKEINKLKIEEENLNKKIIKEENSIEKLEKEIFNSENLKDIFDEYEKSMLKKERLILEIGQKKLLIDQLQDKLTKWKDNKNKLLMNNELDKKIMVINSSLDTLMSEKDGVIREIELHKGKCEVNNRVVNENNVKIDKIKKENDVDKIFRTYLTVYGKNGIIKTIMKSIVPKLNNELMRLLTDVTEFCVEIRVNDKNEVEFWMVDNNSDIEKLVSSGSGFEKTLAALAIRTVLTKVSCLPRPNITVFDEVLGKVSNENLDQVYIFFKKVKEYFENIFLITHNPLVREWGDNIITVTKDKNISKLK